MRPLSIGQLIRACQSQPADNYIFFSFGAFVPVRVGAYRGVYSDLAVEYDMNSNPTVHQFKYMLEKALGQTFEGYKGGEFVITEDTPVWAANYGRSPQCGIIGLTTDGAFTYIETAFCKLPPITLDEFLKLEHGT